jgi:quinoprotein glucose dehydrogenase
MSQQSLRVIARMVCLLVVLIWTTSPISAQYGAKNGEWHFNGGDAGNTRYSPLDQINGENVKNLRIAWRWKADNFGPRPDPNIEATPLMVGGVLYTTAGTRRDVVAIDGATGETLWMFRFDEGVRGERAPVRAASGRGVAYWTDGKEERILHVTPGYHLVALDPRTGRLIPRFGKQGVVDLFQELDQPTPQPGQIGWNSPPMIVRGVVVVGAALQSLAPTPEFVKGYVRGYDVRTGKRLWIFHTVPEAGEFGAETWLKESNSYTGNTGSWAAMAADEELGYVYVGVETPTNDTYGGNRPGAGLFGESLVCLDARTGKRVWYFQMVHHGLWDYDPPTAPNLLDITVNGRKIKAVAQVTKQAFTYVFDRVTGQPVWPIEERPVPKGDVPGEWYSPTQPFPTKPPAFDRQGSTLDDLIDFTPELKAEAVKLASTLKLGPMFTPPIVAGANGLRGVLLMPNLTGGANWQGAAADPETGMLYVSSATNPSIFAVRNNPAHKMNFGPGVPAAGRGGGDEGRSGGAAPAVGCAQMFGPQGLPMVKPPWGRLTAVDLNTGEHAWMVANGPAPDCVRNHPALKNVNLPPTGKPERGGSVVTRTLVFSGEGGGLRYVPWAGGPIFRAYDKKTGQILHELTLPGNQTGNPMTYMVGGKQYIVVAIGSRTQNSEYVALSLP